MTSAERSPGRARGEQAAEPRGKTPSGPVTVVCAPDAPVTAHAQAGVKAETPTGHQADVRGGVQTGPRVDAADEADDQSQVQAERSEAVSDPAGEPRDVWAELETRLSEKLAAVQWADASLDRKLERLEEIESSLAGLVRKLHEAFIGCRTVRDSTRAAQRELELSLDALSRRVQSDRASMERLLRSLNEEVERRRGEVAGLIEGVDALAERREFSGLADRSAIGDASESAHRQGDRTDEPQAPEACGEREPNCRAANGSGESSESHDASPGIVSDKIEDRGAATSRVVGPVAGRDESAESSAAGDTGRIRRPSESADANEASPAIRTAVTSAAEEQTLDAGETSLAAVDRDAAGSAAASDIVPSGVAASGVASLDAASEHGGSRDAAPRDAPTESGERRLAELAESHERRLAERIQARRLQLKAEEDRLVATWGARVQQAESRLSDAAQESLERAAEAAAGERAAIASEAIKAVEKIQAESASQQERLAELLDVEAASVEGRLKQRVSQARAEATAMVELIERRLRRRLDAVKASGEPPPRPRLAEPLRLAPSDPTPSDPTPSDPAPSPPASSA